MRRNARYDHGKDNQEIVLGPTGRNTFKLLVIASVIASFVVSCKKKINSSPEFGSGDIPVQIVDTAFLVSTKNGLVTMRMEAPLMLRFENDTLTRETFPNGISVYAYNDEGLLETTLFADNAEHRAGRNVREIPDVWSAFGNVFIKNVISGETMETDTIYWDQTKKEIYTDCYVKMYSPDGLLQGYGMRSDDRARNAILHNPFNSFGVAVQDSTKVVIDSTNFVGPFPEN